MASDAPPQQRRSNASDILAEARSRIASRKVAGYSDQVAARNAADADLSVNLPGKERAGEDRASVAMAEAAPQTFEIDREAPATVPDSVFEDATGPGPAPEAAAADEEAAADADPFGLPPQEPVASKPVVPEPETLEARPGPTPAAATDASSRRYGNADD